MASNLRNFSNIVKVIKPKQSALTRHTQNPTVRTYADKPAWPPEKLRKKMELFQQDNGIPVYLKGGFGDRILFGATIILTAIGVADGYWTLLNMAFPRKKQ